MNLIANPHKEKHKTDPHIHTKPQLVAAAFKEQNNIV
jgi:hypothetical protein